MGQWKKFFDEEFEDEHQGEVERWSVAVANEGVLFYHYQRPDGWTIMSTYTHADFARHPPGQTTDRPALHQRVSAVSHAVATGAPLPGEEEEGEGLMARLKAGWDALVGDDAEESASAPPVEEHDASVGASYRDAARKPAVSKHNPAINRWDAALALEHLNKGWALDRLDVRGRSALWAAVDATQDEAVVRRLLAAGADPNNPSDSPPLLQACRRCNHDDVLALIKGGADALAVDETGQGTLQRLLALGVSKPGARDVLQTLLAAGVDPNGRSSEHRSPLGCAAHYSQPEFCAMLLDAGADIDACNFFGTALMQAGRADVVRLLIDRGADVGVVDEKGRSALWHACKDGTPGAVAELLDAGADPRRADAEEVSPRQIAERRRIGRDEVLNALTAKG